MTSSIPGIHINTCCATVVIFTTVNPILSVPYLQFLVAWHRQRIGKVAENELWRCVGSFIKTVEVFVVVTATGFQVFGGWQNWFFIDVCDDSQQTVIAIIIINVFATPIGCTMYFRTVDGPRHVDEFHCLKASTLCDIERTILVTLRPKANRFCIYLLPVLLKFTKKQTNKQTNKQNITSTQQKQAKLWISNVNF